MPETCDWITMAADGIRSRYADWEAEAEQIAQCEQCSEAGEFHLQECIVNYLRWMQANHSRLVPHGKV